LVHAKTGTRISQSKPESRRPRNPSQGDGGAVYRLSSIIYLLPVCVVSLCLYRTTYSTKRNIIGVTVETSKRNQIRNKHGFRAVLFLRNKLRPASGRFPVSRNETEVQNAWFVSMSSLNPCFCIVPWAPYGNALVRGGVVLRDFKMASSKTG
jgi:hypothetical protein